MAQPRNVYGGPDVATLDIDEAIAPNPRYPLDRQGPVGRVPVGDQGIPGRTHLEREALRAEREAEYLRRLPQAMSLPGGYADGTVLSVTFLAAGSQLVLARPRATRILLLIQNQLPNLAANNIIYNLGQPARATNGILIPPGGNRLWDGLGVPQNDLYIYAPAAGVVTIEFINAVLGAP